jgi:predicted nucleic-acid-binding protein
MRAVDTNVLVRLITRDDLRQTSLAEAFVEKGAWVSTVTLVETLWVLGSVYGLNPQAQADVLDMLLQQGQLMLQDREAVETALELFQSKPALGFEDCMILASARKAGHLPLGTFDKNLAKLPDTQRL